MNVFNEALIALMRKECVTAISWAGDLPLVQVSHPPTGLTALCGQYEDQKISELVCFRGLYNELVRLGYFDVGTISTIYSPSDFESGHGDELPGPERTTSAERLRSDIEDSRTYSDIGEVDEDREGTSDDGSSGTEEWDLSLDELVSLLSDVQRNLQPTPERDGVGLSAINSKPDGGSDAHSGLGRGVSRIGAGIPERLESDGYQHRTRNASSTDGLLRTGSDDRGTVPGSISARRLERRRFMEDCAWVFLQLWRDGHLG